MSKETNKRINFYRLLMSEPGLIMLTIVIILALLIQFEGEPTTMSMRIWLVVYGYIFLSIPTTIISRYLQAKMSHLKMSTFLSLPNDDSRVSFFKCCLQHSEVNKVIPKTYTPYNSPTEPMIQVQLQVQSGTQLIHSKAQTTMYQRPDKTIYFDSNRYDSFSLIGYEWNGAVYNTVSSATSTTNGKEKTNGHMVAMTAGAVIGGIATGGVGPLVGAAIGAGGKRKKKNNSITQNNTIQQQIEVSTPATLTFINNRTGQQFGIVIKCNSLVDSSIKCFTFTEPKPLAPVEDKKPEPAPAPTPTPTPTASTINNTPDKYEELKKLKELYDMGIVTSDEFEAKKKQLLNL